MSYGHHHCQDRCESVSSQGNFPVEAVRGIFLVSNLPVGDDTDDGHEGVGGEKEVVDQVTGQDTCLKEDRWIFVTKTIL